MDRRFIEQSFFQEYGYRGDDDELAYYAADNGYYFTESSLSYEQYRHRAPGNSSEYTGRDNTADVAGDVKAECGALFRDIFSKAKKHEKKDQNDAIMAEFAFMALLFLVKSSLYFTLQYGDQHGYCCNL